MFLALALYVHTISDGGSGRFINNSKNIEARNFCGVLCCLSLFVVKMGRDSDDCILDGLTNEGFGDLFHLGQNHGRDFFSIKLFYFSFELDGNLRFVIRSRFNLKWPVFYFLLDDVVVEISPDESLGIENGVQWVLGGLVVGSITDQSFVLSETDVRWCGSVTLLVGDDLDSIVFPETDT
jgi:hypothetical protein